MSHALHFRCYTQHRNKLANVQFLRTDRNIESIKKNAAKA